MWSSWWFWSQRLCRNRLPELRLTCGHSKFFINSATFVTLGRACKIFNGRVSGFKVSLTFSAIIFHHPSMFILHSGSQGVGVYPNYVRVKARWHRGHVNSSSQGHTERQKNILTPTFTFTNYLELSINWMLTCIVGGSQNLRRKAMQIHGELANSTKRPLLGMEPKTSCCQQLHHQVSPTFVFLR